MMQALTVLRHGSGGRHLMVLLPGAYMSAADFEQAGFFATVAQRGTPFDIAAVDLDLEAISTGRALPAVQAEVIEPARQAGYARIWLGGISLGGLLALCHNADTPGAVDGLCLLAPYPGSRLTTNAIARAGGLDDWTIDAEQAADPEFRMWRWLQKPPPDFPVVVGYGTEDRFAAGMQQIAGHFPEACRCAIPGGHEWPVWRELWEHFLDSGRLFA